MTERFNLGAGVSRSEEKKKLTDPADSAANPKNHKYERVPWEVGHVKTKVPGSGQQQEIEQGENVEESKLEV